MEIRAMLHNTGECNRNTTSVTFASYLATLCNQSIAHLLLKDPPTLGILADAPVRQRCYHSGADNANHRLSPTQNLSLALPPVEVVP